MRSGAKNRVQKQKGTIRGTGAGRAVHGRSTGGGRAGGPRARVLVLISLIEDPSTSVVQGIILYYITFIYIYVYIYITYILYTHKFLFVYMIP